MDKDVYFGLMKETSDIVDSIIIDSIQLRFDGTLCDLVIDLPKKRVNSNKPKLRPAIFRFAYEVTGGQDWRKYENIAAAMEMLNLSTYVLNYVLDDKGGEKPKQQRNNECVVSMIQRELAQQLLIVDGRKLSLEDYLEVDKKFSEINRFTSGIGQYLDSNHLRDVEKNHVDEYVKRCNGLTGMFMQYVSEIGGIVAGASKEQVEKLGVFGKNYGILVQIINDLGDYLPYKAGKQSVGKVYQDQYSDLKHGCITFPAYIILTQGTEEEKETVERVQGNLEASLKNCLEVTRAFIRLGGVQQVKKLASKYAKAAKDALNYFPKNEARDFLSTALSIYRTNKFYDVFKKI